MAKRECPFCKEKVKDNAITCKHCRSELPPLPPKKWYQTWQGLILILFGLMIVANALEQKNDPQPKTSESIPAKQADNSVSSSGTDSHEKVLYATKGCQTYNGPSKESGLFYFSDSAKKALTLDERQQYEVIKEQGDWVQIDVFGKKPWAQKQCMTSKLTYAKNTLKKNALICKTKEQFNEFVQNRNDKAHIMEMLGNGDCLCNVTNAEVRVEILEGIFPKVKVKVYWGDEIFVGWTETTMVNE